MHVIDNMLVGLVLLVSIGYAAMSLGPNSVRRVVLATVSRVLAHAPAPVLRRAAQRLSAAGEKASGACGGCDNCGSEQPLNQTEVKIPVAKIGRRV